MPELIPILDKDAIAQKVAVVAKKISLDYGEGELILVGVLKGAFVFLADLIRQLTVDKLIIDFVRISSYGVESETSGKIRILKDIETEIAGKDVLIVEDILDTGLTVAHLRNELKLKRPRSIKICTMIDKIERRRINIESDYCCHRVKGGFIVGYGLDYAEAYRNLPEIFELKM